MTKGASPSQLALYVAVTASWTIGLFGYWAQAQLLDSIMAEFAVGETAAGFLFSAEMFSYFIALFCVAWPLARWSRVRTALFGGVIVVAANVAAAYAPTFEALVLLRVLAGVGGGLVSAAGTASASSSRDPDRTFAVVTVGWGLVGGLEFIMIPFATESYGTTGGYLLIAGVSLALMPALLGLLPPRPSEGDDAGFFQLIATAPNRRLAVVALLALFIYEIGQSGVFTFMEQIGLRSGQDAFQVGQILTYTVYIGLLGGLLAAWMGGRFGRKWPIIIGLGLNTLAGASLAVCEHGGLYIALLVVWNFAYYFLVPFMMGALAALDDQGRWAVAGDSLWNAGIVPGPVIAGALVESSGYVPLAGMSLVTGFACMLMMVGVLTHVRGHK
jgi:predicted MFS family arabinose efflux permease